MPKAKDLSGMVFSRLTVQKVAEGVTSGGNRYWECLCTCGTSKNIAGSSLTTGKTTSCGCYNREVSKTLGFDLTGQIFGDLTVLKQVENRGIKRCWLCQCTCGKTKEISTFMLRSGNAKHCTCKTVRTGSSMQFHVEQKKRLHATTGCSLCANCGLVLEIREFIKNKHCVNGVDSYCGWCSKALTRYRKYGLTAEQYWAMYDAQLGRCAIDGCEKAATEIDHDHTTKKVRGLLCFHCNISLPTHKTPRQLRGLAAYLERGV